MGSFNQEGLHILEGCFLPGLLQGRFKSRGHDLNGLEQNRRFGEDKKGCFFLRDAHFPR